MLKSIIYYKNYRKKETAMDFVKIDSNFKDIEKLTALKEEAFPNLENLKIETFITIQENGDGKAYAVYDKDKLIGYIVFMNKDNEVYFVNLAVDKNTRGKGYGTKILKNVMDYFRKKDPRTYFVLDVEMPHESAQNLAQRESRIRFYKRLGFYISDYVVPYHGDQYVIMTTEKVTKTADHQPFSDYINKLLEKYDL